MAAAIHCIGVLVVVDPLAVVVDLVAAVVVAVCTVTVGWVRVVLIV